MATQITSRQPGGLNLNAPRYNPRPAGVIQEGGASKAVLDFLQVNPERWFTFAQIMAGTGRTSKSLDWACIFLRSLGYVECSRNTEECRNSRYMRYRIKK